MQVQILNYLPLIRDYKLPLFLHGIENVIKKKFIELKQIHKVKLIPLLKTFKTSERMIYHYQNGTRGVSIKFLEELEEKIELITNVKQNLIQKCFNEITGISSKGNRPIILPKFYSEELAYISGVIIGDGHVSKRPDVSIWEETVEHSDFLCKTIKNIFGYIPHKYNEGNYFRILINSAPIHFFFTKVINMPEGKKKSKEKIPNFVYLNPKFKVNFLRGLFDSDGGVTISKLGKKSILLSSVNKNFLNDVNLILKEFGINFHNPYSSGNKRGFELRTFKKDVIDKFNERIGFSHIIKKSRSNAPVAQPGRIMPKATAS